MLAYAEDI